MESFVGCHTIPPRYGMTCGEFARMVNAEEHIGCALDIVRCKGYDPGVSFPGWGRPWVMPSLAMPRYETALLYPGTCLLEGTNLSEGRGTADPVDLLHTHRRRIKQFHVKDMDIESSFADPGTGLIDFGRVFAANARVGGVTEFIVERDDAGTGDREPEDALDTARVGYEFLRNIRF